MKFGLSEENISRIKSVFSLFPEVKEVIIFGSRAKGNFKNGSDIDFAIKGLNLNIPLLNKIHLKLEDLYLPYKFDLKKFDAIKEPELIDHINRVGTVFYSFKN